MAEAVVEFRVAPVEREDSVVFGIERGDLGVTTVEILCFSNSQWIEVGTFSWGNITGDGRNFIRFEFEKEDFFCQTNM